MLSQLQLVPLHVGGLLIDSLGWRGVFGVMGIPGYVLAALLLLTLEDPVVGLLHSLPGVTRWVVITRVRGAA